MTPKRRRVIRAKSHRRAREHAERVAMLKRTSHGPTRCGWPAGCVREAVDAHEVLSRARGGSITDPANIVPLCREHHSWVTCHPAEAEALGLTRSVTRYPLRESRNGEPSRGDSTGAIVHSVPPTPADRDRRQIIVRLPADLVARMDERAARYKLSRNAWIELALTRVTAMPSQVTQQEGTRF